MSVHFVADYLRAKTHSEGTKLGTSSLQVMCTNIHFFRHMEDGCSKRFDIETVTLQPQELQRVFWISSTVPPSMHSTSGSPLPDMYL